MILVVAHAVINIINWPHLSGPALEAGEDNIIRGRIRLDYNEHKHLLNIFQLEIKLISILAHHPRILEEQPEITQ